MALLLNLESCKNLEFKQKPLEELEKPRILQYLHIKPIKFNLTLKTYHTIFCYHQNFFIEEHI